MKKMEQYTDLVLEYLEGLRRVIIDSKNHFRSTFEKYGIIESDNLDQKCIIEILLPLMEALKYVFWNNPLSKTADFRDPDLGTELSEDELFSSLREMTDYGLRKLFNEMKIPLFCKEDLKNAIREGNIQSFRSICRSYNLDFTDVSISFVSIDSLLGIFSDFGKEDEEDDEGDKVETFEDHDITSSEYYKKGVEYLSSFYSECDSEKECLVLFLCGLLKCFESLDLDEAKVINELLNNSAFYDIVKEAQIEYIQLFGKLPNTKIILSEDEIDEAQKEYKSENPGPESIIGDTEEVLNQDGQPNPHKFTWPTDEEFLKYPSTGDQKVFYRASKLGSSSALRMSIIYKLFIFLVNQGKLENTQDNLMLFAFRLTGKCPNPIDTERKLIWLGPRTDYSLCYFVWYVFTNLIDEKSKALDGRFWSKTASFFKYADGSTYDGADEQSRRQDFSKGRDMTDPFACALRETMEELVIEQQLLMKDDS